MSDIKLPSCRAASMKLHRHVAGHIIHEAFEMAVGAAELAAGRPCRPVVLSGLRFTAPASVLGLVRFTARAHPQHSAQVKRMTASPDRACCVVALLVCEPDWFCL